MSTDLIDDNNNDTVNSEEQATARSPGLLDILYGILFRPRATLADDKTTDLPVSYGLIIIVLVSVLSGLWHAAREVPIIWELGSIGLAVFVTGQILLTIVAWVIFGGVVGAIFELMGYQGSVRNLLAWYGLASTPRLFEVPVRFLLGSVPVFQPLVSVVVLVWSLILVVVAGKKVYRASTGASIVATWIIPPLLLGIVMISTAIMALVYLRAVGIPDFLTMLP